MKKTLPDQTKLITAAISLYCFFMSGCIFVEPGIVIPPPPPVCTTAQYNGLNEAKAFCSKDSFACTSTPYGGCHPAGSPWPSNECSTQCQVTNKAPWLTTNIAKPTGITTRTLSLKNSCDFDVWVGYTGASIEGTPSCTKNTDCGIAGAVCNTNKNQCYWGIESLTHSGTSNNTIKRLHLSKKNGNSNKHTASIDSTIHQKTTASAWVKWSGNIWASTECTGSGENLVCETARCPSGGCTPFTGPKGTLSLAEFTLQASAQDFYDISIIGGYNLPIAMKPTSGQSFATSPAGASQQIDGLGNNVTVNPSAYWCTEPGSATGASPLSSCSWDTTPTPYTKPQLRAVSPPKPNDTTSCTKDNDCKLVNGGKSCGLWANSADKIKQVCGSPRGWWSANEICAFDDTSAIAATFDCKTAVAGQGTVKNLYLCNGVNNTSGYAATSAITSTLCGCNDWPYPVNGHGCNGSNTEWVSKALPAVKVQKDTCPTAYSFPFDDETSTFNCQTPPGDPAVNGAITANIVDYTITFCPGDKTGR